MIPIFYRNYPYAPLATLISGFSYIGGFFSAIGAILLLFNASGHPGNIVIGIILAALAVFLFVYVGRTLTDKLAEGWSEKNIKTKARFALLYCKDHPEAYEQLINDNPEFAAKYVRNEAGKIVKR